VLACPRVKSPVPIRVRADRLLLLASLPWAGWTAVGAAWTFGHHPFTGALSLPLLVSATISLAVKRGVGAVTVMIGVAWCQALAAFALHAWLKLPIWASAAFFVVSFVLLIAQAQRTMNRRRARRYTFDHQGADRPDIG